MPNKPVQTSTTADQGVQATQATPKVMVEKGVQTTPPISRVQEAVQEALAINPELKNNEEFQKLFLSMK